MTTQVVENLLKRKRDPDDKSYLNWRNVKQKSYGSEWIKLDPIQKLTDEPPIQVEFELSNTRPIKFTNLTRFHIKGAIQKREANGTTWSHCTVADAAKVCLAPDWFEKSLTGIDVYHDNTKVSCNDESALVSFHLNDLFYHYMGPMLKQFLAPEPGHPARCMPTQVGQWDFGATTPVMTEWTNYAAHIFKTTGFEFSYIPLFMFPFHQLPNYILDGSQQDLPFPRIGKLTVRFNFKSDQSCLFRRAADNTDTYRMILSQFYMTMEEDRPAVSVPRNTMKVLNFEGVTKDSRAEAIKDGESIWRTRFHSLPMPEQILIFALPRTVIGGTWKWQDKPTDPLFLKHNLQEVELSYNGENFVNKSPNFQHITNEMTSLKYLEDMYRYGLGGMRVDNRRLNWDNIRTAHENTLFPHVLINLTMNETGERMRPLNSERDRFFNNDAPLEVTLKFKSSGATPEATYMIYLLYPHDVNMMYDPKLNKFITKYKTGMS